MTVEPLEDAFGEGLGEGLMPFAFERQLRRPWTLEGVDSMMTGEDKRSDDSRFDLLGDAIPLTPAITNGKVTGKKRATQ